MLFKIGESIFLSRKTCKRILTNRLVRFDSYASVPRRVAGMRRGGAVASDWNSPRATRSGRMGTKVSTNDTLANVEDLEKYSELLEYRNFLSVAADISRSYSNS